MATSLLSPLRLILSPNWRPSAHLLRIQSSCSLPALNSIRFQNPSLSQRAFSLFHPSGWNLITHVQMNGGQEPASSDSSANEELEARGESTMPERFRDLCKEVPEPPTRWPWAIALFFLVYTWRMVLHELSNWMKIALMLLKALVSFLKLALASMFLLIRDPATSSIRYVVHAITYVHSAIIGFAPVPKLTWIIFFTSIILAISEATVPESVSNQSYLLTLAGIIGFGASIGFSFNLLFFTALLGTFIYSKFIEKRDSISAALPSAAVLSAVGEPWVRAIVVTLYLALAIIQHAKYSDFSGKEVSEKNRRPPLPLLLISLVIGINLAAKWIRYRHLTWMIV